MAIRSKSVELLLRRGVIPAGRVATEDGRALPAYDGKDRRKKISQKWEQWPERP